VDFSDAGGRVGGMRRGRVKGQNNRTQGPPRRVVDWDVLSDKATYLEMKESRVSKNDADSRLRTKKINSKGGEETG
jgi:hypothetical protein